MAGPEVEIQGHYCSLDVEIGEQCCTLSAIVETGAAISAINVAALPTSAEISNDVVPYLTADGKTRISLGTVHLSARVLGQKSFTHFWVLEHSVYPFILGFDW